MRKSLFRGTIAMLALSAAAVTVSCSDQEYEDLTTPPKVSGTAEYAPYKIDWTEAADSCSKAFIERFYCSENRNGYEGVFSYREYNATGGANFNNYWQQAHAMGAMVEYYNRIKATDAEEKARIEGYFQKWYDKRGNNYEGNQELRGSTGFGNNFTDDTSWIILALFQMYDATGNQTYYDAAKKTWDECVWPRTELTQSGWLPWKIYPDPNETLAGVRNPNECTNGPAAIAASMLAQYCRNAGNEEAALEYIEQACNCFEQNIDVMNSDGTLAPSGGAPLSYTQGTCMEAGRLIWKLTGDVGYLRKAILAGRGQMNSTRMNEVYKYEMISRDEGTDENNSIFHAVMFHWFTRMILDTQVDTFDSKIRKELYNYLYRHASYYWATIDKTPEGWPEAYFGVKCYQPRSSMNGDVGGSLGAYTSAAQAIESMWMIKDVKF